MNRKTATLVAALIALALPWRGAPGGSAGWAQTATATGALGATEILEKADAVLIPRNASFRWALKVEREGEPVQDNRFLGLRRETSNTSSTTITRIPPMVSATCASTRRSGCTCPSPTTR